MSKHLIFMVHGMGKHTKGWSDPAWASFEYAYNSYDELKDNPFSEQFERVEVLYDDVFESYRKRWKDDSSELIKIIKTGDASVAIVEQVINLSASLGKDTFFNTHLLDVVMYRYLSLIRTPVRTAVAKQISKALQNASKNGQLTWSIITHSLGTSVGHDTLHYMFQEGESEVETLPRKQFAPHTGLFVANVSRVLQNTVKAYASLVRPSFQRTFGIFEFYLNAHHLLDPIPRPKPFNPGFDWLDSATREKEFSRYQDIEISEITKPNIHDLDHYLANPGVHIPFIRSLFSQHDIISVATENKAMEKYRQAALALKNNALRDQLINLIDKEGPDIEGLLDAASIFNSIVK